MLCYFFLIFFKGLLRNKMHLDKKRVPTKVETSSVVDRSVKVIQINVLLLSNTNPFFSYFLQVRRASTNNTYLKKEIPRFGKLLGLALCFLPIPVKALCLCYKRKPRLAFITKYNYIPTFTIFKYSICLQSTDFYLFINFTITVLNHIM